MRNRTSALRRAEAFRGLKLSAICRTMLLRYPGNGNSIPSLRTVATSVPLPPVGPPPAFGASVFGCGLTLASLGALTLGDGATFPSAGVTRAGVLGAGFALGSGPSLGVHCAGVGCVTDVAAFAGSLFTSPIALSPGGAATMLTRYIGGSATGFCSRRGGGRGGGGAPAPSAAGGDG